MSAVSRVATCSGMGRKNEEVLAATPGSLWPWQAGKSGSLPPSLGLRFPDSVATITVTNRQASTCILQVHLLRGIKEAGRLRPDPRQRGKGKESVNARASFFYARHDCEHK